MRVRGYVPFDMVDGYSHDPNKAYKDSKVRALQQEEGLKVLPISCMIAPAKFS